MSRRRQLLIRSALRQSRTRQRGVCLPRTAVYRSPQAGFTGPAMALGTEDFSIEFYGTTVGSSGADYPTLYNAAAARLTASELGFFAAMNGQNGVAEVVFGAGNIVPVGYVESDPAQRLHVVLTRAGATVRVYIDGAQAAVKECTGIVDFGAFRMGLANSSDAVFVRLYDRAVTAAEVTTLYNGGDPAGYVLPAAAKTGGMRGDRIGLTGQTSYTWQEDDPNYSAPIPIDRELTDGCFYRLRITVSGYRAGAPFVYISGITRADIPARDGTHTILLRMVRTGSSRRIYLYGGSMNSDRRLTLTVESVTPAGCIAEYLPQNLVPQPGEGQPIDVVGDNSHTWTGIDNQSYSFAVRMSRAFTLGRWYRILLRISGWEAGNNPFLKIGSDSTSVIEGFDGNGLYRVYACAAGRPYDYIALYAGYLNTDRRMTMTVEGVEPADDVAVAWLDSACTVPHNDAFLPPLLETASGYDLSSVGKNLILRHPTLQRIITPDPGAEAENGGPHLFWTFTQGQLDGGATVELEPGVARCRIGSVNSASRPIMAIYGCPFVEGRTYRLVVTYTLVTGGVRVHSFGSWQTGAPVVTGEAMKRSPGTYRFEIPPTPCTADASFFRNPSLYFATDTNTEFIIDQITIEAYV